MTMSVRVLAPALFAFLGLACNSPPPEDTGDEWAGPTGTFREVFRDDFDGDAGSAPNPLYWNVQEREFGQNQELDYNTTDRKNSYLDGAGNLVIEALKENYVLPNGRVSTQPYTSARMNTAGLVEQTYGRFEARIWLPSGKGLWPAFWVLGNNIEDVGWPKCGEVDVVELAGSRPGKINGSMHGPGYAGTEGLTRSFELDSGTFAGGFHVFAIEWAADGMRWLVDGKPYHARTPEGLRDQDVEWVFNRPMYMILNLAVGGFYDGEPDGSTAFPAKMVIDYVSVSALE
jgi:beta-glucanase (GH16 family)